MKRLVGKLLIFLDRRARRTEQINGACLVYNPRHTMFIREYYLYCVDLFRRSLRAVDAKINVIFGDYTVDFGNGHRTARVDIQFEHTLVKPGGRDSAGAISGKIAIGDGPDRYLVRIQNHDYLKTLDLIIEYSMPNMVNMRESGVLDDFLKKTVHISPLIYDMDFGRHNRAGDLITLFSDVDQPRRKIFLDRIGDSALPSRNVRGLFDKAGLQALYKRTKILINVHQTGHHDTFEELRVLPALLRGVVIVSEDVPVKEHIPYGAFIIWSSYENMIDTARSVYENYDHHYQRIFNDPALVEVLKKMEQGNIDNVGRAVRTAVSG